MTMREKLARALCESIKQNPDQIIQGEGWYVPRGFKGPAWEGYAHQVDVILDGLMEPTLEILIQVQGWSEKPRLIEDVWQPMIRAIREGK